MAQKKSAKDYGGAAMEYILISTFGALVSLTAIGIVTKIFKTKLEEVSEKLGVEFSEEDFRIFDKK